MNTNEVHSEPAEVQPGSYTADALAKSVEEKFAALFSQAHPPITSWKPERLPVATEGDATQIQLAE